MNLTAPSDRRKLINKNRKKKKERDIIYLPTKQTHTRATVNIGLACRALLGAMYVSGICLFVADAFCIVPDKAGAGTIFLSALFFSAAITLLFYGGIVSAVGGVLLAGGIFTRLAIVSVDFPDVIVQSVAAVHNTVIERAVDAGVTTVHNMYIILPEDSVGAIYSEADLYKIGLVMLTLVVSLYLVPVIVKRCHPICIALITVVFVVPASIYNIIRGNWGFSLLVASIAGVVVLWTHDRNYTKRSKKKRFIKDDEPVPLFEDADEPDTRGREKKKRKGAVEDVFVLESNADRRRRLRAERKAEKAARREEKRARRLREREQRRAEKLDGKSVADNLSLGGITGLSAAVMALLIIAAPAQFVTESDPGIPFVSDIVSDARKYVNAIFWSQKVDLNKVPSPGGLTGSTDGPRPTDPVYPEYKEVVVATVEVPYNAPVYLRSWVGTTYDDDHWYSATLSEIDKYTSLFGEDFTPETITDNFYNAMYPTYSVYADASAYADNTRLGFIYERVSVTNKADSTLLYLPSFVRPSVGLLSYNSNLPSLLPYSYYFDGIWTSSYFFENTSYTTESLVTTMRYPEIGSVYARGINEYLSTLELIASGEPDTIIGQGEETALRYAEMYAEDFGAESAGSSLIYRYLTEMTDAERASLRKGAELERTYSEYVRGTYLQTDDNDEAVIGATARVALREKGISLSDTPNVSEYHDTAMALIDYLGDNYRYSKEPPTSPETADETTAASGALEDGGENDLPNGSETPALIEFLTETKTGYCVQFASSLAMMLRSLGIPARYCEGYVASDFSSGYATDRDAARYYSTDVLDSDAHAWVEVYYDGLGWVQYEATPSYHDAMYGSGLDMPDLPTPGTPDDKLPDKPGNPVVNEPEQPPKQDEVPIVDDTPDYGLYIRIAVAAVAAIWIIAAVVIVALRFKSRSKRALREREKLIERCRDTDSPLSGEELRSLAHKLDIGIFDVYGALGLSPETGELPDEYAARLDRSIGGASDTGISAVLDLVSREEFGHSLTREGVFTLANYYDDLTTNVYEGLSWKDKFVLRGIRRVV